MLKADFDTLEVLDIVFCGQSKMKRTVDYVASFGLNDSQEVGFEDCGVSAYHFDPDLNRIVDMNGLVDDDLSHEDTHVVSKEVVV